MAQRDYDKEYREHGGTERQKKRRAARKKATVLVGTSKLTNE